VTYEEFRDTNAFELLQENFLGFMTLRPIRSQIVGRTVLSPKIYKDNNFMCCLVKYNTLINGIKLNVYGFPFCSQDGEMLTCAETTVLNLLEYFGTKSLFKFHLEIRLTINRTIDNWMKAIPDSGNLS